MKTEKTRLSEDFKLRAELFKSAFLFQCDLQDHAESKCGYRFEVEAIIESIDRLMATILDTL